MAKSETGSEMREREKNKKQTNKKKNKTKKKKKNTGFALLTKWTRSHVLHVSKSKNKTQLLGLFILQNLDKDNY